MEAKLVVMLNLVKISIPKSLFVVVVLMLLKLR